MYTDRQGDLSDLLNDLLGDAVPEHPIADDARWRKVWRASVILMLPADSHQKQYERRKITSLLIGFQAYELYNQKTHKDKAL